MSEIPHPNEIPPTTPVEAPDLPQPEEPIAPNTPEQEPLEIPEPNDY